MFSFGLKSSGRKSPNNKNGNGLLLYHHYQSFYSQKVVFALHEKNLKFESRLVDLRSNEQYQPWYMQLNPKAEVPTLTDGVKVIPDSSRIIDYLEDNFSNGDIPRLLPEKGSEKFNKVKKLQELLDQVHVGELLYGAMFFPDMCLNSNITPTERNSRIISLDKRLKLLASLNTETMRGKLMKMREFATKVKSPQNLENHLKMLKDTLDVCEQELKSHTDDKSDWWLCCESFTISDICLSMLLIRLRYLGFYDLYVNDETNPCIAQYFQRVQSRDSYKAVISQLNAKIPKCGGHCSNLLAMALSSAVLLGIVVGVAVFFKRLKN